MPEENPNISVPFWKRREFWGPIISLLSYSPELINSLVTSNILPEHTLIAQLALPLGIVLTIFGLRRGLKDQNLTGMRNGNPLPEGMRKMPDQIKKFVSKFK